MKEFEETKQKMQTMFEQTATALANAIDAKDEYSWWSYRFQARQKNAGWRIDYFVISDRLRERMDDARIHTQILGSDHCPVELTLK